MNFLKSETLRKIINPLFFIILAVPAVLSFDHQIKTFSGMMKILTEFQQYFISAGVCLGILFVFINKKRINEVLEDDRTVYNNEKKRDEKFRETHPGINRIPVVNTISRFIYNQGWIYSLALLALIVFSIFFLSYRLGDQNFYQDEYQVVDAAEGYLHSGSFTQWDDISNTLSDRRYERAWPDTWMIAQAYKLFGISEWSSRIVSVLFGILFVPIFYIIAKYFTRNQLVALLAILCALLHPELIRLFRYARMYAVLIPIFSLLFYCLFRFLTEENRYDFKSFTPFINKNLNYNYLYLLPCLILLIFNYLIHINSLIIFPILYILILILTNFLQTRKYIIPVIVGGVVIFLTVATNNKLINDINIFTSFLEVKNFAYLGYLTAYPFASVVNIILLLTGLPLFFLIKNPTTKIKLLYLYVTVGFTLVFFIFMANRYPALKYASHLFPIFIMLYIYLTILFTRVFRKKWVMLLFAALWIFGSLNFSSRYFDKNFGETHPSFGNPSIAYQTLIDRFDPKNEVILGQYLRGYYLKGLGNKDRIINMLSYGRYTFPEFWKDINKYGAGWVVIETRKLPHMDSKVLKYITKFFKKVHGTGIDHTNIEMFHFNRKMIDESIRYFESLRKEN